MREVADVAADAAEANDEDDADDAAADVADFAVDDRWLARAAAPEAAPVSFETPAVAMEEEDEVVETLFGVGDRP